MPHIRYRTKGVFLKKENKGEDSQIFTLFTEDFGKIKILARAIRKITSKLRAGAEVFYFSEIEFIQGRHYKTLTNAVLIKKFILTNEIIDFENAGIVEAIDKFMPEERPNIDIWRFLIAILESQKNNYYKTIFFDFFLWKLFATAGYSPELYHCVKCRAKLLPKDLFFSIENGGVVCGKCVAINKDIAILPETVKILRLFLSEPITNIEKLKITRQVALNLRNISRAYLTKGEL